MSNKDHYKTLQVNPHATKTEIENAYQRLVGLYHPDKNPNDRINAQKKFNDVCEAYYVLSNPGSRASYDQLKSNINLDTAVDLFAKFFENEGFDDRHEEEQFNKLYPDRKKTYYEILGVPKNASQLEVERAFRKLSLRYHPKNNPGDAAAEKKFIEVCEAYNQLYDEFRRRAYDDYTFGEILPLTSHNFFLNFFNRNPFTTEDDTEFFKPLLKLRSSEFDKVSRTPEVHDYYEAYKTNSYQSRDSKGELQGKTVTEKTFIKDGKRIHHKFEETLNPDGTRDVVETINEGGQVEHRNLKLKAGEPLPLKN